MNCTILTIGTELLMGQIINSNAAFLSKELNEIGIDVHYNFTVGDNPKRLKEILNFAASLSDIIITTGGLGPTQDDLTKEIIGECFSKKLVLDNPSFEKIKEFFIKNKRIMTENNIRQAYFPESSIILSNEYGTAPGFILETENKIVISLPGPPREMTKMYFNHVKPYLLKKSSEIITSKMIKFIGIGESQLEDELMDLINNQNNPTLATYADKGEVSLRVTAKAKTIEEAEALLTPIVEIVKSRLDKYIYSINNEKLEEVIGRLLINNNISISLAESCTGGLLAAKLTSIPGISKVFDRCIVSYSNKSKIEELGVPQDILNKYGAVSSETAKAMCEGLRSSTNTDISLSITGIAGPSGETKEKPVGLVYIGIATKNNTKIKKFNFTGDRERIRTLTVMHAMNLIRETLKEEFNCY